MKIDVLAFAAHPDDVELAGCGTLLMHQLAGKKIGIIDLTRGELGTRGTAEIRKEESDKATQILNLDVRENLSLRDGFFENNEESKLAIIKVLRKNQPEIVLANSLSDRHIDHGRAARLVADSCFLAGLRKIETSDNNILQEVWRPKAIYHFIQDRYIKPDIIVDISPVFDKKMEAIMAFKSQFYNPDSNEPETPISGKDFIEFLKARAIEFGRPIGVKYAEGFNVERPIGTRNLLDLL